MKFVRDSNINDLGRYGAGIWMSNAWSAEIEKRIVEVELSETETISWEEENESGQYSPKS